MPLEQSSKALLLENEDWSVIYEFDGVNGIWRIYWPNGHVDVARSFKEIGRISGIVWQ